MTLGYGLRLRAPIRRSRSPPGQPGQAPSGQAQAQSNRDFKFLTRRVLQQLRPGNPRPAAPGTPIPVRGRIGKRGFPVSRPFPDSGESGNGDSGNEDSPFPEKLGNGGIGNPGGFLSDEHQLQWTRNILSREYHASALTCSMRVLFRVRGGSVHGSETAKRHKPRCSTRRPRHWQRPLARRAIALLSTAPCSVATGSLQHPSPSRLPGPGGLRLGTV